MKTHGRKKIHTQKDALSCSRKPSHAECFPSPFARRLKATKTVSGTESCERNRQQCIYMSRGPKRRNKSPEQTHTQKKYNLLIVETRGCLYPLNAQTFSSRGAVIAFACSAFWVVFSSCLNANTAADLLWPTSPRANFDNMKSGGVELPRGGWDMICSQP